MTEVPVPPPLPGASTGAGSPIELLILTLEAPL